MLNSGKKICAVLPWFWRHRICYSMILTSWICQSCHFCYKPYNIYIPWILLMNLFKSITMIINTSYISCYIFFSRKIENATLNVNISLTYYIYHGSYNFLQVVSLIRVLWYSESKNITGMLLKVAFIKHSSNPCVE
jgi:hypothetical protein